jgi:hypothetical protein
MSPMKPTVLSEIRPADAEPFSAVDFYRLKDALDRLLEYEEREWPTREHYIYIQRLERLRHEIAKRTPSP